MVGLFLERQFQNDSFDMNFPFGHPWKTHGDGLEEIRMHMISPFNVTVIQDVLFSMKIGKNGLLAHTIVKMQSRLA